MTSNMYLGILLLTISIGMHVSAAKNCTTTLTCPEDCCGSFIRYCCAFGPSVSTETPCTRTEFDGSETKLNCQNDCCGNEFTRYCCIKRGGGGTAGSKSCTQKTSLFDDTTTTLTCPNGCCGGELTRYCCTDFSDIQDFINAGASLSRTVIIIIAVSCVVFVAIIVGIIICCCCCCRKAASSSSSGRPGVVVTNGQAHSNTAYNPGKPVSYPMTQQQPVAPVSYPMTQKQPVAPVSYPMTQQQPVAPQGQDDLSKTQYQNVEASSTLYPDVQAGMRL